VGQSLILCEKDWTLPRVSTPIAALFALCLPSPTRLCYFLDFIKNTVDAQQVDEVFLLLVYPAVEFVQVMELMTCNRIHRLYVVGSVESASPITGLITMSDILKVVAQVTQGSQ
jgi:hypothetical protein